MQPHRGLRRAFTFALCVAAASPAIAQISISTAVDLALASSPRVKSAQDDVRRAAAQIDEAHDAYIPSINAGAAFGQSYGYSPNPPTLFTVTASSLAFNASQVYYGHSARAGFTAATLTLRDVRQFVAQDAALAFLALDHDQQREQAIRQQSSHAASLVTIVQQRFDAGQDTRIDLKQAQITAAQLRLAILSAEDATSSDRDHLARLIALPAASLQVDSAFPDALPQAEDASASNIHGYANAAVAAAFATAEARQQQARGDATFRYLPQINFFAQYNRYATFTNSFKTLQDLNNASSANNPNGSHIGADEAAFGVQIVFPFLDKVRSAKARESQADAAHALHDAQFAQLEALDGQERLRHSIAELEAQRDLATLRQQYAQLQLDAIHVRLQTGSGNTDTQPMSPKDEQKAQIDEREQYLSFIDSTYQLRQTEVQLLRQTGGLLPWIKSTTRTVPTQGVGAGSSPR
jgi:outer membrane protein TolC